MIFIENDFTSFEVNLIYETRCLYHDMILEKNKLYNILISIKNPNEKDKHSMIFNIMNYSKKHNKFTDKFNALRFYSANTNKAYYAILKKLKENAKYKNLDKIDKEYRHFFLV